MNNQRVQEKWKQIRETIPNKKEVRSAEMEISQRQKESIRWLGGISSSDRLDKKKPDLTIMFDSKYPDSSK